MSLYLTAPGVERVKIGVYSKRHGKSSFPREERKVIRADVAAESITVPSRPGREMCYADFFRSPAASLRAAVA